MAEDHTTSQPAIRTQYQRRGVATFYRESGASYRNPHEPEIRRLLDVVVRQWKPNLSNVLDLAAGSGEVTLALHELGARQITGIDPHTHEAYQSRTGASASRETFEDIAAGALRDRKFTLIVCSFAMHLVDPPRLPGLALQLSRAAPQLLILTPHKRPLIQPEWGWQLDLETVLHRVRARAYRSTWG